MNNKLVALLKSRKFWAAVVGLAMIFVKAFYPQFPLSEEQLTNAVLLLVAFIGGTAVEDGARSFAVAKNAVLPAKK